MIKKIWALYKKYDEVVRYLIAGGITTLFSLAAKFICAWTILDADIVWQNFMLSFINWTVGVTTAFILSRKYVFKNVSDDWLHEAKKFVLSRIATYFMDAAINLLLVNGLHQGIVLASTVAAIVVIIANYVFSKLFVFTHKKENVDESPDKSVKENVDDIQN
ncbi:MAG: GtrA family protein [Clostridium sp.]|jgi:putative flippase GtrA|nr:GtrA family protein [Clostridium sp.]